MSTSGKSQVALNITYLCYLALLVLLIGTSLPTGQENAPRFAVVLSIKLIPLLLVLRGLWLYRLRAFVWLCFIVLFYFTRAVVDAFLDSADWESMLMTILTVCIFMAAMYYVKWERQLGREL